MGQVIRPYQAGDEQGIWQLNTEVLGYAFPYEDTVAKLATLAQDPQHRILVAEVHQQVVGYIHGTQYDVLYAPSYKDIMGLAVAKAYQHRGLGRALLAGIEAWGKETGAAGVRLVSGAERLAAHAFYEGCGYQRKKGQVNFRKTW